MTLCLALHAKQNRQLIGQLASSMLVKRRANVFRLSVRLERGNLV
jgi:hypothetical protein